MIALYLTAALAALPTLTTAPMEVTAINAGTHVEKRTLAGRSDTFPAEGAPVWVHVTVKNPGGPSAVTMVWSLEEEEQWRIDLPVGQSPRWRTWSRMRMHRARAGQWRVEALNPEGEALGEVLFDVEPAPGRIDRSYRITPGS